MLSVFILGGISNDRDRTLEESVLVSLLVVVGFSVVVVDVFGFVDVVVVDVVVEVVGWVVGSVDEISWFRIAELKSGESEVEGSP